MWAVQHATLCQMMFFVNRSRKTNAPADWLGAVRDPLDFSLEALFRPIADTPQTFWLSRHLSQERRRYDLPHGAHHHQAGEKTQYGTEENPSGNREPVIVSQPHSQRRLGAFGNLSLHGAIAARLLLHVYAKGIPLLLNFGPPEVVEPLRAGSQQNHRRQTDRRQSAGNEHRTRDCYQT